MARPTRTAATRTTRVQIPAYTDRWMMGDRYGEVLQYWVQRPASKGYDCTMASVKLDKSGKTVTVIFDDCTEV